MSDSKSDLVFYHSPWSRSVGVRWLLEELGVPYAVHPVHLHAPGGADEAYRAIHPHKKVPALEHGSVIITERAAITIYLADAFAERGLAPAIGDPARAAYLTMLVYCDAVFDPCVASRAHGHAHAPSDYSFGAFDDVMRNLEARLGAHPYAAGSQFTAADTQLASSLAFTMNVLGVVPRKPVFEAYLERVGTRPAFRRAQELDAALLQEHPELMPANRD